MKPIRILIADDHAIVRIGLAALLRFQKGMKLVGEAEDGESAVRLARETKPDVMIMDLMMPGICGAEAIAAIPQEIRPRILILTSFGTAAELGEAVKAGAAGVILKGAPPETLLEAIRTVAAGGTFFPDEVRRSIAVGDTPELTERQTQVLDAVARGLSNPRIADELDISTDAVKQHLAAVFAKLGADNRTEAIAIAAARHLLSRA